MINLFQFGTDDKSLQYLAQIFGYMNGVIPIPSKYGALPSGDSISILGTMFKTFNSVVLTVGALIIIYVTIMGVMKTAHEGEPMGKNWSNLWIPIRTVLGIAALVPTGSGYSAIQLVMMWVIVQGIGAADNLWGTALSYINLVGSPTAQVTIPSLGVDQKIGNLYKGLVCDATANVRNTNPTSVSAGSYLLTPNCNTTTTTNPKCPPLNNPFTTQNTAFNDAQNPVGKDKDTKLFKLGPEGSCGQLTYCNQESLCSGKSKKDQLKCTACKGQVTALEAVIPVLSTIAQQFVQNDYYYRQFKWNSTSMSMANNANNQNWKMIYSYCNANSVQQAQCCANGPGCIVGSNFFYDSNNGDSGSPSDDAVKKIYWPYSIATTYGSTSFINTAVSQYMNTILANVTSYIQDQAQYTTNQDTQEQDDTMGGTLGEARDKGWILAGSFYYAIGKHNGNNLKNAIPLLDMSGMSQRLNSYRNNYSAADVLVNVMMASGDSANPATQALNNLANSGAKDVKAIVKTSMSSGNGTNPLVAVQNAGITLLVLMEAAFAYLAVMVIYLGMGGYIDFFVLGTGMDNPAGPTLSLLLQLIVPALYGFAGIMITLGGMLGVYVPLIPYVIFTFGAIAWFMSTIEAMIAGPLLTLHILNPSGQHELLGNASHGLMMLFGIFLMPSLRIFSLIAAMLLASVSVAMVNATFQSVMDSIGTEDPLGLIFFLAAYVILIVTVLNKCFAAIYLIPRAVLGWMQIQTSEGGEGDADMIKGAVSGAAGRAVGGVGRAAGGIKAVAGAKAQEVDAKEKAKKPPEIKPTDESGGGGGGGG